ncbi:unnamed protein product, partial [Brenthis ino]
MVVKLLSILLIIPTIYAKINIDVIAAGENKRDVKVLGSIVNVISKTEQNTFGLTDEKLKQSVSKYFGLVPDNVYVHSPTPWGDLYKTMNWEPIRRVVVPQKAAVLSVKSEPVLVARKEFVNEDVVPKTMKTEFREYVTNAISSKWDTEGELDVEDIMYELDMKTDPTFISFSSKWGQDSDKYMPMTVGSEIELTLAPNQKYVAELYVTKEEMMIRVDYETSLRGSVAINFDKEYRGHKFWAVDVNTLSTVGGFRKVVHSSEIIEYVQFIDANIVVKDPETEAVIKTLPLKFW